MDNIPFKIHASAQGQRAIIRITGTIGWDTDSEQFRREVDGIVAKGITDAHLYLNGPGGSCFDAEEIVNILSVFKGKVTGEGGTLVASAYTRIAMFCESFTMPENGMFMIHPPAGGVGGKACEIESYLKLIKDIEARYYETYKKKAKDATKLDAQWKTADWWMTAKEALEEGFITSVKKSAQISAETNALITACGCPPSMVPTITNNKPKEKEMDLTALATAAGLTAGASEADVIAQVQKGLKAITDLAELRKKVNDDAKVALTAKIKETLDGAIEAKRITADQRANWEKMLTADFESANATLQAIAPVKKVEVQPSAGGTASAKGKVTYQGKTFEELQDEDPGALADLETNDVDAFNALFDDYKKRNKL